MNWARLTADAKRHEAFRSKSYKDSKGVLTIGYGLNLDEGITEVEAAWLLNHRLEGAVDDAERLVVGFADLDDVRQEVVVNMIYNLGPTRFAKFVKLRAAFAARDFVKARAEMIDSKWHDDV